MKPATGNLNHTLLGGKVGFLATIYLVSSDGLDPQTVQMKSIVPLLPRSGDIAGRHDIAMTASGLVLLNSSLRFAACQ